MPRRAAVLTLFFALCGFFCILLAGQQASANSTASGLDPGFGAGGLVRTGIPELGGNVSALVQQPDGKIVAAGSDTRQSAFIVLRYSAEGVLDRTFGTDGVVLGQVSGRYNAAVLAMAMVLQPDGKIVVAGCKLSIASPTGDIVLARYLPDGSFDPTFGQLGVMSTDVVPDGRDCANALLLQPDGKLVIAGVAAESGSSRLLLARYLADGSLDGSFGSGGIAIPTISGGVSSAAALVMDSNGAFVAAGSRCASYFTDCEFALVRVSTDGALDPTFGQDGLVTTRFTPGSDMAEALVLQPDGRLVAGGVARYSSGGSGLAALARYNNDGSPDPTFGNAGRVTTSIAAADSIHALALDPLGKIIAAGTSLPPCNGCIRPHGWVARYSGDTGRLDLTFGGTGVVTDGLWSNDSVLYAVLLQPSGRIVVGGRLEDFFLLAAYDASPDPTVVATRTSPAVPPPDLTRAPVPVNTAAPAPIGCTLPFTDVAPSDYYYAAVRALYCSRTISGYSDNTFRPGNPVTRSQLAKMVATSLPLLPATPTAQHFTDVPPSDPFYQYIETLYEQGIVSGYDGPTPGELLYHPGAFTTRAQVSKVLSIAAGWTPLTNVTPHFSDVSPNDPFFGYIESARAHRVITGYADGTFRPGVATTRGQLAKMMYVGDYLSTQAVKDDSR